MLTPPVRSLLGKQSKTTNSSRVPTSLKVSTMETDPLSLSCHIQSTIRLGWFYLSRLYLHLPNLSHHHRLSNSLNSPHTDPDRREPDEEGESKAKSLVSAHTRQPVEPGQSSAGWLQFGFPQGDTCCPLSTVNSPKWSTRVPSDPLYSISREEPDIFPKHIKIVSLPPVILLVWA